MSLALEMQVGCMMHGLGRSYDVTRYGGRTRSVRQGRTEPEKLEVVFVDRGSWIVDDGEDTLERVALSRIVSH